MNLPPSLQITESLQCTHHNKKIRAENISGEHNVILPNILKNHSIFASLKYQDNSQEQKIVKKLKKIVIYLLRTYKIRFYILKRNVHTLYVTMTFLPILLFTSQQLSLLLGVFICILNMLVIKLCIFCVIFFSQKADVIFQS